MEADCSPGYKRWVQRCFVAGTDTGVGKTEVASALLRALAHRGLRPWAFKPYESGVRRRAAPEDASALRAAAGGWQPLATVSLHRFRAPLAPGVAARLEGRRPSWRATLAAFRRLGPGPGVAEGAGGLLVPLDARRDVVDLAKALALPVVLVARAGLGTLNHTRLSLEALHTRRLPVAAVVLVASTRTGDASVATNRAELRRRFPRLPVLGPVPYAASASARARALAPCAEALLALPEVRR